MLAGDEAAGAAETGLDLVGDEQRAVLAAEPLRLLQVAVVRQVDALSLDRFEDEGGDVAGLQRALQGDDVVERHAHAVAQQRLEPGAEQLVAVQRQRAHGQAVEGVITVDDLRAAGRGAGELDRPLHRFRAGIAEEDLVEVRQPRDQPFGQQAGQQRGIHLHQAGEPRVQHAAQRVRDRRVVAADGEDAEAAQQVQVAVAGGVEQVGAFAADVVDVEADRLQHADELRVEVAVEQRKFFGRAGGDQLLQIERHRVFLCQSHVTRRRTARPRAR